MNLMSSESAKLAWITRKENEKTRLMDEINKHTIQWEPKPKKMKTTNGKSTYNRIGKNAIRDLLYSTVHNNIESILSMDTHEYLLSKKFSDKKVYLAENNLKEYMSMSENKPSNVVILHLGDVGDLNCIQQPDAIWLDFCGGLTLSKPSIIKLSSLIQGSKYVAFTFSTRGDIRSTDIIGNGNVYNHHESFVLTELQSIGILNNFHLRWSREYYDGCAMITVMYENKNTKEEKQ